MRSALKRIRNVLVGGLPAVDLQEEVQPYLRHLKGLVLNAGAGHRPVNTGLPTLSTDFDAVAPVDFLADLHYLPLRDECVDSVLSVAVLEHTRLPWVCARELWRVLKPGGAAVICVPFLQPEHAVPHDFFRYTVYGLRSLLEWAGFSVHSVERLGRQHRVLAWIILEMGNGSNRLKEWFSSFVGTTVARWAKTGNLPPWSVYAGSYAVAQKPGAAALSEVPDTGKPGWFFPLLVDPVTKSALRLDQDRLVNQSGESYPSRDGKPDLRPAGGLSQDHSQPWPARSSPAH
jgi:SAM-dependent methyltransferase